MPKHKFGIYSKALRGKEFKPVDMESSDILLTRLKGISHKVDNMNLNDENNRKTYSSESEGPDDEDDRDADVESVSEDPRRNVTIRRPPTDNKIPTCLQNVVKERKLKKTSTIFEAANKHTIASTVKMTQAAIDKKSLQTQGDKLNQIKALRRQHNSRYGGGFTGGGGGTGNNRYVCFIWFFVDLLFYEVHLIQTFGF